MIDRQIKNPLAHFLVALAVALSLLLASGCSQDEPPTSAPAAKTANKGKETAAADGNEAKEAPVPAADSVKVQAAAIDTTGFTATAGGLHYKIVKEGAGPLPAVGQTVKVHYTGKLADGTVFDSSRPRGEPIAFLLGKGRVIRGWDEGIALLKVGSQAQLIIPAALGYGAAGVPPAIPGNATLIFDVELLEAK